MALVYKTSEGDMADFIAWKHYGYQNSRIVEKLLDANPGLADLGPRLPEGISVILPAIEDPETVSGVHLWD